MLRDDQPKSAGLLMCQGGIDEALEQRMRPIRAALEFRMGLGSHEKRMVREFDHFHDAAIR